MVKTPHCGYASASAAFRIISVEIRVQFTARTHLLLPRSEKAFAVPVALLRAARKGRRKQQQRGRKAGSPNLRRLRSGRRAWLRSLPVLRPMHPDRPCGSAASFRRLQGGRRSHRGSRESTFDRTAKGCPIGCSCPSHSTSRVPRESRCSRLHSHSAVHRRRGESAWPDDAVAGRRQAAASRICNPSEPSLSSDWA